LLYKEGDGTGGTKNRGDGKAKQHNPRAEGTGRGEEGDAPESKRMWGKREEGGERPMCLIGQRTQKKKEEG